MEKFDKKKYETSGNCRSRRSVEMLIIETSVKGIQEPRVNRNKVEYIRIYMYIIKQITEDQRCDSYFALLKWKADGAKLQTNLRIDNKRWR